MGRAAVSEIGVWEARITQLKHETYEDEDAWETMLAGQLRFLMDVIDRTAAPVTEGAKTRHGRRCSSTGPSSLPE